MANADFSYWRKQTRLTIPEAVHLLCDVEPPAWTPESRYATARLVRAHQALITGGVIRSEAAKDSVLPTTWVERTELVQAIASGKLPDFGEELLRAAGFATMTKPQSRTLQTQREAVLEQLRDDIPESGRTAWGRSQYHDALKGRALALFSISKPTFRDFWRRQSVVKLPDKAA